MGEGDVVEDRANTPRTVGQRLRDARVEQSLDLNEIALRTRIPLRHLEAIETSNHSALPSTTYAMGFARAYARVVELDEAAIARDLRDELSRTYQRREPTPDLEPMDEVRGPSRTLAVAGVLVALVILVAVGLWYGSSRMRIGDPAAAPEVTAAGDLGMLNQATPGTASAPVPPPAATGGQVTLTATDEVWVRVYDADNTTLLIKTMAAGERYDVPADANQPMINIGRPDKLAVTINGSVVAPLGSGERAIKDVGISAQALRARDASPAATPAT